MYSVENGKIGEYLKKRMNEKGYGIISDFCRDYLKITDFDPNDKQLLRNLSNRLSQILKGKKGIQVEDLPVFCQLLDVSCEMILSGGEDFGLRADRVSNYYIASSRNSKEWKEYVQRKDKLILNCDEYRKTVIDYALEFGNYEFLKFLMDNNYIYFVSDEKNLYSVTFGAGTTISPREYEMDNALRNEMYANDKLRTDMISLAIKNNGFDMLDSLKARETPLLYKSYFGIDNKDKEEEEKSYNDKTVEMIANSSEKMLDYFTDEFEVKVVITEVVVKRNTFMYPYLSQLIDKLITNRSSFTSKAIKKAIKHNEDVYEKVSDLLKLMQEENDKGCKETAGDKLNNPIYEDWVNKLFVEEKRNLILGIEKYLKIDDKWLVFDPNMLCGITGCSHDKIITNLISATKKSKDQNINKLINKLNESYEKVKSLNENIKEIIG